MPKINENYLNVKESYLFSEIAHRVDEYTKANPDKKIIRLGIGDVTLPLGDEVIKALHGEIRERLQLHKESKDPEPPEIYIEEVDDVLKKSGINEEKIETFNEVCEKSFGEKGSFNPTNIMESRKFEMVTPQVKITVDPEYAFAVRTEVIDGSRYILIPAGEGVEVNGIPVEVDGSGE